MLSLFRTLFTALLVLLSISYVFAASAITKVVVPITDQQQVDPLLSQGLTTVLVRLTGNPAIAEQKAVTDILKNPNDYLENYSQQSQPDRLIISYDQTAIEQALTKAGIGYWESRRPVIMTWWLNDAGAESNLIGDAQPATKTLTEAANSQGFPLRFPLADLTEQAFANKENFNAENPKEILQGSTQYAANAILVVYAQQKDNNYQAKWRLWLTNNAAKPLAQGDVTAATEAQAAEQIFTAANPALAKVFVIKTASAETLEIVIKDVDFSRYVQVNNLMASFNGKVIETAGSTVRYQVNADPAQIKAQLGLLHFVEQPTTEDAPTTKTNTLIFHASDK